MKTHYFKINDFDLNRGYNNYFWDRALSLPKLISLHLKNGIKEQYKENYRIREDDLNIKLFHIFYVLKKYVDARVLSLPKDIWIGMRQYSTKFTNKRKGLGYVSGDFDFIVGGLEGSNMQADNIIGIETKIFRYESQYFDENYTNQSEIKDFKLRKHLKNDGIMPGLKQIISYKYFCDKVILFYTSVAPPIQTHKVIEIAYNEEIIRKTMRQLKDKYKDKIPGIPADVGFCISGIVQVPGKDSLDSGTPTCPDIIKNPSKHDGLLPDRKDFIDAVKERIEKAETVSLI